MRQIGTIADEGQARQLADHLLTLDISSRLDPTPEGWAVWVHREERVPQARAELDAFLADPSDPKYRAAAGRARELRKEAERLEREHRKNTRDVSEAWAGPDARRCPVTYGLIAVSIAVFLYTGWGEIDRRSELLAISRVRIVQVQVPDLPGVRGTTEDRAFEIRSEGLEPILRGQIWRLVTPIFLHFGPMHIIFNMYMLYVLGSVIELRRGTARLAGIVLVAAVLSNLGQFAWSGFANPLFGGMSGVVYALLGYIWMKQEYEPELGLRVSPGTVMVMILWMLMGMFASMMPEGQGGMLPRMANAAHLGGLLVGGLIGLGPHLLGGRRDE